MAYLKKIEKIKRRTHHEDTPMRDLRQQAYQNTQWRKTREQYLRLNPLCEECLKNGKVTAASSVHHKESPFKTGEINYTLLLDFDNLEAICESCHGQLHSKGKVDNPEAEWEKIQSLLNNIDNTNQDDSRGDNSK